MIDKWIRKTTGVLWPAALTSVMLWLTICLLIGALTPAAILALGTHGTAPVAGTVVSTTPDKQPATYRYAALPDGTTEVQRSNDGGLTWLAAGLIPELVVQLAVNPTDDAVMFARTGASLWGSRNSGLNWARIDSLPGQPIALALAGSSDPSGLIFAGTDTEGLFSSLDGGTTWQSDGSALSSVGAGSLAVTALAINPDDQHVVYAAATFTMATPQGRHSSQFVFVSVNDGRQWFEMTPAPRFDQPITRLLPLSGQSLAVLLVGPFGTQMVSLEANPALISGLDDADAGARAATAQALGLSYDRSLLPVLMGHLRDPDLMAGDQVARAIGRLGDPAAVPLLMPALYDTDEIMRARAATALGLLQAEQAIPPLNLMLKNDGPWARRHAAEALAAIGTPGAIAALIEPLHDAEMTPVRFTAMAGLEIAGQTAVMPLQLALMDNDPVVRRNAAEVLGWLRAADATPSLARLLSDRDASVQTQAGWSLGEMQTDLARGLLHQAAADEAGKPIRQTASKAARVAIGAAEVERQNESSLRAALPSALAQILLNRWTLGALATLVVAILAATVVWIWKGPRPRLGPSTKAKAP